MFFRYIPHLTWQTLRGNPRQNFMFAFLQTLMFSLLILCVLLSQNFSGTVENEYLNSEENRTMYYHPQPPTDSEEDMWYPERWLTPELLDSLAEKIGRQPHAVSVAVEEDHLVVEADQVINKEELRAAIKASGCAVYEVQPEGVRDYSEVYLTVIHVIRAVAAMMVLLFLLILCLFIVRDMNGQAQQLAILKTLGYRPWQVYLLQLSKNVCLSLGGFIIGTGLAYLWNLCLATPIMNLVLGDTSFSLQYSVKPLFYMAGIVVLVDGAACVLGLLCFRKVSILTLFGES